MQGPWVVQKYADGSEAAFNGWFPTGDIANVSEDCFMEIVDRKKDMIKSGGEWISSVVLEDIALSHDAVKAAACIGVPHPIWQERPLVVIVLKDVNVIKKTELLSLYEKQVPRFWVPEFVFVNALPLGATNKVQKAVLRGEFANYFNK